MNSNRKNDGDYFCDFNMKDMSRLWLEEEVII